VNRFIPPNDPKAVRRRRRAVDGPVGDQPAEFDPHMIARVMRCPACRSTISTMRRWRMVCPDCAHEWEEPSNRTIADAISDARTSLGEYAVMAIIWTGMAVGLALLVGLPLVLLYLVSRSAGWTDAVTLVAAAVLVAVAIGITRHVSRSNDSTLRRVRDAAGRDESRSR
jgi:hypothetical protein